MSLKDQHVTKRPDGLWQLKGEGNSRATRIFDTQRDAIEYGRDVARNQGSELVIHRPDGRIRDKDSHGRDPYPPRG
ncbi:DUF2188 domain-containing protein [Adlercreutzia equolifaciens]|uniref:DUF2188 domain-containing protein n=1 Tax=Adlercreutzia equolifaciens TaxID=446660 RepID=UPI001CC3D90A|nr:DUF2188 domain-containing protein [Adlercreutzia equolifaciens]